ncbi:glycosyltransferase involved in cell wall biosynthesis [Paenibacillus cellulosilyticus]|uniref:Glycosyltransferase involved in cell wall biosynthesis n=1 Tax=Paenibacillus cellulosilyticus TaxID=375489 RepID=A0A2V2YZC5_9BACL|nr:glycosyltransferase family 1 protein [Paenibacillus cellulosilyticus]PWW07479.1 glycosyltransferase involved in cell wall biosynthesis [Paenibacillus cellulosilyticus]QKS44366.1 glycosyltransferase family 1 protein [Paenibacillus cellulosilyticus]
MRLAIFTDTYEPEVNGVARTLGRWTDFLRRQGIEVMVFAPDPAMDHTSQQTSIQVQRFTSFPFFLYPECRLAVPNPVPVRRALQLFQPTLIHVATPFNMGLFGIHYAKKYRIPLVASYHTHFDRYLPYYNLQWMAKLLWRYMEWFHHECRMIFVPSPSTKAQLVGRGWRGERLLVWPRGIKADQFYPGVNRSELELPASCTITPEQFVVLYVGRLSPEKDVGIAIDAFDKFRRSHPDAVMLIAGDGPSASELAARVTREQLPIHFLGFQSMPALRELYAAADAFMFPSATETFGNVVLEAMACGAPVIGARAGGVADTVTHGVNGLLCDPGHVDSFVDALERLYHDPEERGRLSARGLAYSRNQSWDAIFGRLLSQFLEAESGNTETMVQRFIT